MGKKTKKKKPVVNIDSRVSKRIREEKLPKQPKGKPKADVTRKEVKEWFEKKSKGKIKVISDSEFKKASAEKQFKSVNQTEAKRLYLEEKHDWFFRYTAIEGSEYKKKISYTKIDRKTGEEKEVSRTRTFRRFRDTLTGRFISYKEVREQRKEMRKELAIYKMAERKRISVEDARDIYEQFEEEGMERYIMKEYAGTPD